MTTISGWMMMLAVMYGMIPSAKQTAGQRPAAEQVHHLVQPGRAVGGAAGQVDAC
jgi:hypothetical protein